MKGILIVNHFLAGQKYSSQTELYCSSAEKLGIRMDVATNCILPEQLVGNYDFALFLDKDIRLARQLELLGIPVFNSSSSISLCDDKSLTYLALKPFTFPMPKTRILPMTFFATDWTKQNYLDDVIEELHFPMVVKEALGSFGAQVWLVNNREELVRRLNASSPKTVVLQEMVQSSYGRDIRLQVVGNQVVASMYRYSENDFRANISNGGKMTPYDPSEEQISLAVSVCEKLGLTFGGVDLLFGEDERPVLCEVNSNAHIVNLYQCTGINVADAILKQIILELERKS